MTAYWQKHGLPDCCNGCFDSGICEQEDTSME